MVECAFMLCACGLAVGVACLDGMLGGVCVPVGPLLFGVSGLGSVSGLGTSMLQALLGWPAFSAVTVMAVGVARCVGCDSRWVML